MLLRQHQVLKDCFMIGVTGCQHCTHAYLIGSLHMSSHASSHWVSGSERTTGSSLMADSMPPPWQGRGIPPWVQNIWQLRVNTCKTHYMDIRNTVHCMSAIYSFSSPISSPSNPPFVSLNCILPLSSTVCSHTYFPPSPPFLSPLCTHTLPSTRAAKGKTSKH